METILVGVDNSPAADAALAWAWNEATSRRARLVVLLACDYLNQPRTDGRDFDPGFTRADAQDMLERIVERVRSTAPGEAQELVVGGPLDVELRVAFDHPARALLEASRAADLVVVGSRGLGGFQGLRLGSVSQQVLAHAQCPVVVHR